MQRVNSENLGRNSLTEQFGYWCISNNWESDVPRSVVNLRLLLTEIQNGGVKTNQRSSHMAMGLAFELLR